MLLKKGSVSICVRTGHEIFKKQNNLIGTRKFVIDNKEKIDRKYTHYIFIDYKYLVQQGNILLSAFCTTLCQRPLFIL